MNPGGTNGYIAEESPGAGGALSAAWRPAGLFYLAAMLIGLAVGLWPWSIGGSVDPYSPVSVPAVQTLVVAQVAFYLVVYPLIVLFRASSGRSWRWWPDAVVETFFWTLLGAAFFVPAVWLSGSVPSDAIRGMVYVCGFWPVAWVCGAWLASRKAGGAAVMFGSIFAAMGLPWLWYVSVEFFSPAGWHGALWRLSPVMQAWDVAAPRGAQGGLSPLWSIVVWPLAAGAMFALWAIVPARGKPPQVAS
ncbi:MAG: hypothetical protein QGH60_14535 [Phycisphaerae bacterium]|jgi:hypothetical protein|nr:hypothetical protein [Phycisphaerae bacterium]